MSVVFSTNVEFGWLINLQRAGEQERWSKENKTLDFAISEHLECAEQCECSFINPSTMIFPSDILQTIPCSSNRFFVFFLNKNLMNTKWRKMPCYFYYQGNYCHYYCYCYLNNSCTSCNSVILPTGAVSRRYCRVSFRSKDLGKLT